VCIVPEIAATGFAVCGRASGSFFVDQSCISPVIFCHSNGLSTVKVRPNEQSFLKIGHSAEKLPLYFRILSNGVRTRCVNASIRREKQFTNRPANSLGHG
jgi:hypothetical protein